MSTGINLEVEGPLRKMIERRKLGITLGAVLAAVRETKKDGELVSLRGLSGDELDAANAENADAIAMYIIGDNAVAWSSLADEGRDWAAFFAALIAFIGKLRPLIMLFI